MGDSAIFFSDKGEGRCFLLLHGGTGPAAFAALAEVLSKTCRVILPTHPGFNGQPRPDSLTSMSGLATAYLALLDELDVSDVTLVGNSAGGWIAGEMALRGSSRLAGIVLLNAVGIDPGTEGKTTDPLSVEPARRLALSFHNPQKFGFVPSPEQLAVMAENQKTLRLYAGEHLMYDPTLGERLAHLTVPALVVWGESDQVADVAYGRLLARRIPGARFELVPEAGHFPQIEQQETVLRLLTGFTGVS